MEHHLLQRGYTEGCIRDAVNKASSIPREDALVDKTNDNQLTRVPFLVTYNPKLPSLSKILKESQFILHSSERCATVFPEVPLVSYRRSRNLTDMLCSRRLAPDPTTKPNRDNDSSSSNHRHSNKTTDPNKDNKSDESNNGNECPECGRTFKIQKAYKYDDPLNIIVSWILLDSGLVALIKDVTFVNRENSARPCLVRKTRENIKSYSQSHVKLKMFSI